MPLKELDRGDLVTVDKDLSEFMGIPYGEHIVESNSNNTNQPPLTSTAKELRVYIL